MKHFQGRLINHVHLRVRYLERSRRFYRAVLESLGLAEAYSEGDGYFCADELYVDEAAFVLDPDGNNIEAVCEEPTRRAAAAIVVERLTNG